MRVLVTRPEPGARETAARLAALGHEAIVDPLFRIEPVDFDAPAGPFAALAVTSANALRIAGGETAFDRFRALPLFVVGAHSAEAARAAGFSEIVSAEGDAVSLARKMTEGLLGGVRVLYLAGEHRARDLQALTAPAGIEIETLAIYRARASEGLNAETAARLGENRIDAVLHYSRRAAETFIALSQREKLDVAAKSLRHLCLSEAVAAPLRAVGADVAVAAEPDENSLLALLGRR